MIQINLLPDVKQELIKTERTRNFVISISIIAGIVSVGVVALLGMSLLAQKALEANTQNTIESRYEELSGTQDISDMVTIQNQLTKISSINQNRSMDSRLLDVIAAINPKKPNNVKYSGITLDPTTNSFQIEGTAEGGYPALETFKKTILNAKVQSVSNDETGEATILPLATEVVVGDSSTGQDTDGKSVLSFQITVTYTEGLFDNSVKKATIVLPNNQINVTDSRTRVPNSLFTTPVRNDGGDQ